MHKIPLPQAPGCPWHGMTLPSIQFCEANLCSWITQPANTWSNLVYFFIGYWMWRNSRNHSGRISRLIGPIVFLIGMGSFFFHASATFVGQFFDIGFMFLFSSLIVAMNLRRAGWIKPSQEMRVFSGLAVFGTMLLLLIHESGIPLFATEICVFVALELKLAFGGKKGAFNYRELKLAVLFLILSQVAWQLDFRGIVCDENNHWLQGHAAWHILNSIAFIWFYKFTVRLESKN